MNKSNTIKELAGDLARAQAKMPVIKMDAKNPFLKYKYATLGAVINTCRPILAEHNLSVVQLPVSDGDKIGVTTTLIHSSGEWVEDTVFIPIDEQKGLSVAQTVGVAITYLRRYSLASLLGLYADEDTDASGEDGAERPPLQLERKPAPEPKVVVPATDLAKLKADFSTRFKDAKALGITLPSLSGGATEEQIKAAIANADKLIVEKKGNGQSQPA